MNRLLKRGFTLIELLVVIAIIAVIVAFALTNFVGARQRAKDIKKKSELQSIKTAIRLYYNDNGAYPGPTTMAINDLDGCGTTKVASCINACTGQFAAGPNGCDTVYMKQLPPASSYAWYYRNVAGGDDFCIWTALENPSDADIANSHIQCQANCNAVVPAADYVVCAD
ncbi:hypothetical protein A2Z00_03860 [Candidatus Gottesmanbacteria bacterium RBG_13_45_10]|uniref:Type II secretion system protein GspG C-terminal domain-containing protein n=1 Tax=Candidatus Gottesmanbacteria bacterium RBG_13_45_10 TaxID=1798370 RepID=A0A1F5ZHK4_9BACT|nr:MAG: hypothetical protein A2Z00_03860 [Candidatus Gottesmanbacteria bacterium RBG_13_45_10]